jgi:hypothetical protein
MTRSRYWWNPRTQTSTWKPPPPPEPAPEPEPELAPSSPWPPARGAAASTRRETSATKIDYRATAAERAGGSRWQELPPSRRSRYREEQPRGSRSSRAAAATTQAGADQLSSSARWRAPSEEASAQQSQAARRPGAPTALASGDGGGGGGSWQGARSGSVGRGGSVERNAESLSAAIVNPAAVGPSLAEAGPYFESSEYSECTELDGGDETDWTDWTDVTGSSSSSSSSPREAGVVVNLGGDGPGDDEGSSVW